MHDFGSAQSIADELVAESQRGDRKREETAGHNLYAEIHMARGEWHEAVAPLEKVLQISQELGDVGIAARAHTKLARTWLELGDTVNAAKHVAHVAAERPANAELLRLQARLAAANGDADAAVRLMTEARLLAGETWQKSDDVLLDDYRTRLPNASQTSTSP